MRYSDAYKMIKRAAPGTITSRLTPMEGVNWDQVVTRSGGAPRSTATNPAQNLFNATPGAPQYGIPASAAAAGFSVAPLKGLYGRPYDFGLQHFVQTYGGNTYKLSQKNPKYNPQDIYNLRSPAAVAQTTKKPTMKTLVKTPTNQANPQTGNFENGVISDQYQGLPSAQDNQVAQMQQAHQEAEDQKYIQQRMAKLTGGPQAPSTTYKQGVPWISPADPYKQKGITYTNKAQYDRLQAQRNQGKVNLGNGIKVSQKDYNAAQSRVPAQQAPQTAANMPPPPRNAKPGGSWVNVQGGRVWQNAPAQAQQPQTAAARPAAQPANRGQRPLTADQNRRLYETTPRASQERAVARFNTMKNTNTQLGPARGVPGYQSVLNGGNRNNGGNFKRRRRFG